MHKLGQRHPCRSQCPTQQVDWFEAGLEKYMVWNAPFIIDVWYIIEIFNMDFSACGNWMIYVYVCKTDRGFSSRDGKGSTFGGASPWCSVVCGSTSPRWRADLLAHCHSLWPWKVNANEERNSSSLWEEKDDVMLFSGQRNPPPTTTHISQSNSPLPLSFFVCVQPRFWWCLLAIKSNSCIFPAS